MWDFFFLLVSKYVFAHTGKICFAITKGHAFNKPPNYGFLLSSSFDEVFYKFETTGGSRVTGTYPSLSMLFMPGPENFSLSSQEAWSPVRGKVEEESTKNLVKEITKKKRSHFINGMLICVTHLFKTPPLKRWSLFVLSTGTGWLCKKHCFLQTLPFTYPYTTGAVAVSLKARKDYMNKIFSVENDLTVL